jgi:hypothetical protein
MTFENHRTDNEAIWERGGLVIKPCLGLADCDPRHSAAPAVVGVPFRDVKPTNQIDAYLRAQAGHVISKQLLFEGCK